MKLYALFLLLLIFCLPSFAQTPAPSPVPAEEVAEVWRDYAPLADDFSVEVPGPVVGGVINSLTEKSTKSRAYSALANGVHYFIFSDAVSSPEQNRMVFKFTESEAPGIEPNEIYSFMDSLGYHHKVLMVKNKDRALTFQTVTFEPNEASTKRFFDGVKISGVPLRVQEREALQAEPSVDRNSIRCTETSTPAPVMPATGSGVGTGSGTAATPIATATPEVTPIIIQAKPAPSYNDRARDYQIAGAVRLRVTFLANGKIGTISPVKRLPFGLTEEAILAACQMEFKPATKSGIPYTVIKQVVYNFTIY